MPMDPVAFIVEYKLFFIIVHVLTVVVGMGAAIVTDVLCFRFGFNKKLSSTEVATIRFLSHVVSLALCFIVATGISIFWSDPERYLASVKFLTKMTIVSVLVLNGILLHRYIFTHIGDQKILTSPRARNLRKFGFALGAISIVSWISALTLGILLHIPIAYDTAIGLYTLLVGAAIIVSQIIEWVLLERRK